MRALLTGSVTAVATLLTGLGLISMTRTALGPEPASQWSAARHATSHRREALFKAPLPGIPGMPESPIVFYGSPGSLLAEAFGAKELPFFTGQGFASMHTNHPPPPPRSGYPWLAAPPPKRPLGPTMPQPHTWIVHPPEVPS